ncbi:MAG: signal peptide peptidase SppA [Methanosarcinaceae archaeon]
MKSFFKLVSAVITAFLLLFFLLLIIIAVSMPGEPDIKDHSYLVINYTDELLEYAPTIGIEDKLLGDAPETLQRILSNLEKTAVDERIDGVILSISGTGGGYAMLEEIRGAISNCRAAGKKVFAYGTAMSRKSIFLAAACDSIFMPPTGYFSFKGLAQESFYIKGMLEKIGIKANLHKIKDYKTAAEMIQEEKMTSQAREMSEWMLDELWNLVIPALTKERNLSEKDLIDAMQQAVFSVQGAQAVGLIDNVLYWEQLENRLKQPDEDKLRLVSQSAYAKVDPDDLDLDGDQKIAVVHAQGFIGGSKSGVNPLLGPMMGSSSVISDLRKAQFDDDIAAVVFRVNSGGGDHLTSDLIGHQIEILAKKKPVVVSMVDVAASGGYSISYRANKIVANTMTVTGSIGSILGTFNIRKLYHKLGITKDIITKGSDVMLNTDYRDFTRSEWKSLTDQHWDSFNDWLRDVAEHRGFTFEEAEKLAHGRVWSGRQAKANGLIDEVGGLDKAIEVAKSLAEIPVEEKVTLIHYPKEKTLPEMILSSENSSAGILNWVLYRYFQYEIPKTLRYLENAEILWWEGNVLN